MKTKILIGVVELMPQILEGKFGGAVVKEELINLDVNFQSMKPRRMRKMN